MFFINNNNKSKVLRSDSLSFDNSITKNRIEAIFSQCSDEAITQTNLQIGLKQGNEYKRVFDIFFENCVGSLIAEFNVIESGNLESEIKINSESITVNIIYPIKIKQGESIISFENYFHTYDLISNMLHRWVRTGCRFCNYRPSYSGTSII